MSARRVRTLSGELEDKRLVSAALDWVARQRRRHPSPCQPLDASHREPQALFRGLSAPVQQYDPAFLAHGLLRPEVQASGKSREPELTVPVNFAFRLRHLLGVGARAEAVRFMLTVDVPWATVAAVASSAGHAKRNVQETLGSLHAAGAVSLVTLGSDQRYGIKRTRWADLLGLEVDDLPIHRDWPELLSVFRVTLRWVDRPELDHLSDYLRARPQWNRQTESRPELRNEERVLLQGP